MTDMHPPAEYRPPIEIASIVDAASALAGYPVQAAQVALALMEADLDGMYEATGERVGWAVWDKETPINGVEPNAILGRPDFAAGEIYQIWIDDELVFLQPHSPDSSEPVWADEVDEVASLHAGQIVHEMVVAQLASDIAASAPPPPASVDLSELVNLLKRGEEREGGA